jgi:hypothetical protein
MAKEIKSLKDLTDVLIDRGLVKKDGQGYALTEKWYEVRGETVTHKDIRQLCKEYLELWPQGVKSGGYYVRSGFNSIFPKLQRFVRNNRSYTPETILKATRMYIEEKRKENWSYMTLAEYFIFKDGSSRLEDYCQAILDNVTEEEEKVRGNIV